uniref:hypothetical protein n=1 Tax=Candidatus Cryptobacteroides bacterium TaxID=3085639 RepID=UPI004027AC0A
MVAEHRHRIHTIFIEKGNSPESGLACETPMERPFMFSVTGNLPDFISIAAFE